MLDGHQKIPITARTVDSNSVLDHTTSVQATSANPDTCILLTHGFGGGVFAWRRVMQRLADSSGCRVLAFDRAGFGALTST